MSKDVTIYGNIMETKEYSMFKQIKGNRKINKANYAKIVNSMKEEQLVIPIVVNERYEIEEKDRYIEYMENKIKYEKEIGIFQ